MNYKSVRSAIALLLAAIIALTVPGCAARRFIDAVASGILPPTSTPIPGPTDEETPEPTQSVLPDPEEDDTQEAAADRILVPFPDMIYTRPSVDITVRALSSIANQVRDNADDPAAVGNLIREANSVYASFETETVLAMIHDAMDRSDPYWSEEYAFCSDASGRIAEAYSGIQRAYREARQSDPDVPDENLYDISGIVDVLQQHSSLSTQYQSLLSTLTADLGGKTFTYAEITTADENEAWHARNARTLGEVYVELLKVRQKIAQAAGYPDYVAYAFDTSDSGYTREMVEGLLNQIQEKLVPISTMIGQGGIYGDLDITEEEMLSMLRSWLPQLDESMAESLDLMTDYLLYDFSVGPYKDPIAFTTYLPSYAAPFLMLSFDGSYGSFADVLHEFGHFNNYAVDPTAYTESPDIGEVFSTALPLLCCRFLEDQFGAARAEQLRKRILIDCLNTFPYQAYFVGFELAAYSLPEDQITYENLCAISEQQWYRFGQVSTPMASVDWTSTIHLVDSPFYVLSYIVATDVAMQVWEKSISDEQAAMDTYYGLMENTAADMGFMENITAAGLQSPFSEEEMSLQSAYFTAILLMDRTPEQARAAQVGSETDVQAPAPTPEPVPTPTIAPTSTVQPESTMQPEATREPEAETSRPRFEQHFGYTDGNYVIPIG